jgi:hypothetical protein
MTLNQNSPLPGFVREREWAAQKGVTPRTVSRYRRDGLLAYLDWAGQIWIDTSSGEELLRSRVKRRNPPRASRAKAPRAIR